MSLPASSYLPGDLVVPLGGSVSSMYTVQKVRSDIDAVYVTEGNSRKDGEDAINFWSASDIEPKPLQIGDHVRHDQDPEVSERVESLRPKGFNSRDLKTGESFYHANRNCWLAVAKEENAFKPGDLVTHSSGFKGDLVVLVVVRVVENGVLARAAGDIEPAHYQASELKVVKREPMSFQVDDLVCAKNARNQQVFTVSKLEENGRLLRCAEYPVGLWDHEAEPKPLEKGDIVRHVSNAGRFEVVEVWNEYLAIQGSSGPTQEKLANEYRAVRPQGITLADALNAQEEEPSFAEGDLVQYKGSPPEGVQWVFTVSGLTDGGRTVFLGEGEESQHVGLQPKPIQVGDMIRTLTGSLKGPVTEMFGGSVFYKAPNGMTEGLPEAQCRATSEKPAKHWPCGQAKDPDVDEDKPRSLNDILAEIQECNEEIQEAQRRRRQLKKEARQAFRMALKVGT